MSHAPAPGTRISQEYRTIGGTASAERAWTGSPTRTRLPPGHQRVGGLDLPAHPVLLAPETVQLHLAVEGGGVDQRVFGGEVDEAPVLAQDTRQVVLLGPAEVLLERHLVVVAPLPTVRLPHLFPD